MIPPGADAWVFEGGELGRLPLRRRVTKPFRLAQSRKGVLENIPPSFYWPKTNPTGPMALPSTSARKPHLDVVILSPHRLVPLALGAAGRARGEYEVVGAATDANEALALVEGLRPDVLVFDPTTVSLGRSFRLLEQAAPYLRQPESVALLLEPAQAATAIAARFLWEAGARCAMTSQEPPDVWPVAIMAAARGATYVSPVASELFDLPSRRRSGEPGARSRGSDFRRRAIATLGL
jgi:DNA-binding NarL/FixJ family response regulator